MSNIRPTAQTMVNMVRHAISAPNGFEAHAGQCKRFVRQVCEAAGVPSDISPPVGLTAMECEKWYRTNHPECVMKNGSVPGDILFFSVGHGPDGHTGFRMPGNELGENSVAHAPEGQRDGRGYRPLAEVGEPSAIVRVWR
jgi:hypothetical protein